jgi:hypothetical protein
MPLRNLALTCDSIGRHVEKYCDRGYHSLRNLKHNIFDANSQKSALSIQSKCFHKQIPERIDNNIRMKFCTTNRWRPQKGKVTKNTFFLTIP